MAVNKKKLADAQKRIDKHPGGSNLKMITSSERAKELNVKAREARKRNKERVQSLREFWNDFDKAGLEIGADDVKGVDVLKFLMKKAFYDEDFELAGQYAEKIAQYETPKLASQQITQTNVDLKDLSEEEFLAELKKLEEEESMKGAPEDSDSK